MDNIGAQQMRFRCAIAAINHEDTDLIHVFCQDNYGGIREVTCQDGKWSGGTEKDVVAHGILGTPVVALCNNVDQLIHVFYIGDRNTVRHVFREQDSNRHGEWREGNLNHENIEVAPYSMMAGCTLRREGSDNDKQEMRVYVQLKDNSIQEYGCEVEKNNRQPGGQRWKKMERLGRALPGTGMACTCSGRGKGKETCIRLFLQDEHNTIVDQCTRDGKSWEFGNMSIKQALPRTDLAATSCGENDTRVFYIDRDNRVREMKMQMQSGMFSSSERWTAGEFDHPCVAGSQVAAVSWGGRGGGDAHAKAKDDCNIRVYFQAGHEVTAISEWVYRGKWEEGRRSLPPA
ncbi:fucose-specific lectin [Aspergillus crustosus]